MPQFARKAPWGIAIAATVLVALIGAGYCWYRYTYPYGPKHACLACLGSSLLCYAGRHNGHFPTGGGCPEASLSLLYREEPDLGACVLSGKTKSTEAAQELLERGELLGPDTCDWHYVEGLTQYDDPRLALVWDKVGLGHNGQRLPDGSHTVLRVGCIGEEVIPESEWPKFLEEQERLLAARTEAAKKGLPALTAKVRLPSGEIVDHYDGPYTLAESWSGEFAGSIGGTGLDRSRLIWGHMQRNGTLTLSLSLNGWISKPVDIEVSKGKATPDAVVIEMQAEKAHPTHKPPGAESR